MLFRSTLSKHGSVNRGICEVDKNFYLQSIKEVYHIKCVENQIYGELKDGVSIELDAQCYCSLNLWGFLPTIFETLENQFQDFLSHLEDVENDEFLLPNLVQNMIEAENVYLDVLPTNDEWFGMTYQEDKELVKEKIENYHKSGKYPIPLFSQKS